jgi:hypothetical protein
MTCSHNQLIHPRMHSIRRRNGRGKVLLRSKKCGILAYCETFHLKVNMSLHNVYIQLCYLRNKITSTGALKAINLAPILSEIHFSEKSSDCIYRNLIKHFFNHRSIDQWHDMARTDLKIKVTCTKPMLLSWARELGGKQWSSDNKGEVASVPTRVRVPTPTDI